MGQVQYDNNYYGGSPHGGPGANQPGIAGWVQTDHGYGGWGQQTMNMMNTINEHNPCSALPSSTTPNGTSHAKYVQASGPDHVLPLVQEFRSTMLSVTQHNEIEIYNTVLNENETKFNVFESELPINFKATRLSAFLSHAKKTDHPAHHLDLIALCKQEWLMDADTKAPCDDESLHLYLLFVLETLVHNIETDDPLFNKSFISFADDITEGLLNTDTDALPSLNECPKAMTTDKDLVPMSLMTARCIQNNPSCNITLLSWTMIPKT
jgi:hypothetical protein